MGQYCCNVSVPHCLTGQDLSACAGTMIQCYNCARLQPARPAPVIQCLSAPLTGQDLLVHVLALCYGCPQSGWAVGQCCSNVSVPHSRGRASLHVLPLCFLCPSAPLTGQVLCVCCGSLSMFQPLQDFSWQCHPQALSALESTLLTASVSVSAAAALCTRSLPASMHVSVFQLLQDSAL